MWFNRIQVIQIKIQIFFFLLDINLKTSFAFSNRAIFVKANVQPGENVLITGIGGGVALTILNFVSSIGANAYVTSSDDSKIKKAIEQLGAKGGVNYKEGLISLDPIYSNRLISPNIKVSISFQMNGQKS